MEELVESVGTALNASKLESGQIETGSSHHWESLTLQHLRGIAAACQHQSVPRSRPAAWTRSAVEIDWQIERTKGLFQRLLELGS